MNGGPRPPASTGSRGIQAQVCLTPLPHGSKDISGYLVSSPRRKCCRAKVHTTLTFSQRRWIGSGCTWGRPWGLGTERSGWRSGSWHRRSCGSTLSGGSSGLGRGPHWTSSPRRSPGMATAVPCGGRMFVSAGLPAGLGASALVLTVLPLPGLQCSQGCGAPRALFPPLCILLPGGAPRLTA